MAVAGIVFLTNPQQLSPAWLAVPLILLFLAVFLSLKLTVERFGRQSNHGLTLRSRLALIILTSFPAMLLLLQSIGQLSLRDVITLSLIVVVLGVYIAKTGFMSR